MVSYFKHAPLLRNCLPTTNSVSIQSPRPLNPPKMSADIHQIPKELVDSIAELLPVADLKNSRFISPTWNSKYTRCCLFKTVVLRMNLLSYRKLRAITRDSTLRKYVEYIIYDFRTVQVTAADEGLTRWGKNIAGT